MSVAPGWRVVNYPRAPHDFSFLERRGDVTRLLAEGHRIEVTPERVRFAAEVVLEERLDSCRSGDGWAHLSEAGEVFTSGRFLGALREVGQAPNLRVKQCGPVMLLGDYQPTAPVLVTPEGLRPLPAAAAMYQVEFASLLKGRAIAAPDLLFETLDGGVTWHAPSARPAVDRPESWLTAFGPRDLPRGDDAMAGRVLEAWLARAIASEVGSVAGGLVLPDGTRARSVRLPAGDGTTVIALRRPGEETRVHRVPGACALQVWGARLLCDGGDELFEVDAEGVQELAAPPHRGPLAVDGAGRFMAVQHFPQEPVADLGTLRVFDGQTWLDSGLDAEVIGISGDTALLEEVGPRKYWIGTLPELRPRGPALDDLGEPSVDTVQLFEDAVLVTRREGGRWSGDRDAVVYLERVPLDGGARTKTPIGPRVDEVRFADGDHGVATRSSQVPLLTSDGGRTWREPQRQLRRQFTSHAKCWRDGCAVDDDWVWTRLPIEPEPTILVREEPPAVAAPPVVAPAPSPPPDAAPAPVPPGTRVEASSRFDCPAAGLAGEEVFPSLPALLAAAQAVAGASQPPASPGDWWSPTTGGLVASARAGVAAVWRGHSPAGDFLVTVPELHGEGAALQADCARLPPDLLHSCLVELVAPRFSVWSQNSYTEGATTAWVVRATGEVRRVMSGKGLRLWGMPLRNGGALLVHDRQEYQLLVELDPDGRPLRERWVIGSMTAGFAEGPEGPALVLGDPSRPLALATPEPASALVAVPVLPPRPELCRTPPPEDALRLALGGIVEVTVAGHSARSMGFGHAPTHSTAVGLVELAPGREPCLRGATVDGLYSISIEAEARGVVGQLVGANGTHRLRCTWQETPAP